jgi:D-beta-D-heptose 7-phosphate kinase/D-beta-D-heptose 1-phosphate adenosyltransferase
MSKLIITSGYYEVLHVGHIECLQKAKELGDYLVVIVNNDNQAKLKKGHVVMPEKNRLDIISSIKYVDLGIISIDKDSTVCATIEYLAKWFGNRYDEIIFAKGGDRYASEIPESSVCKRLGIKIIDGLGSKIDSSSNYYIKK